MDQYTIKLPEVGEGVAQAELVEWLVEEGEAVIEDQVLAAVMTDKATIEIPSPVEGRVIWRGANLGDIVAVGSAIIRIEVEEGGNDSADNHRVKSAEQTQSAVKAPEKLPEPATRNEPATLHTEKKQEEIAPIVKKPAPVKTGNARAFRAEGEKPLASPAVRQRALEGGIDLRMIAGSGPAGRITHNDIDAVFAQGVDQHGSTPNGHYQSGARVAGKITQIPMIGLRRKIAEKMVISKSRIPHITYVEEIDVTALETLRARMNESRRDDQPKLTMMPFLMKALVRALEDSPKMNARFDEEDGKIHQYDDVHLGVATQTDAGLLVPVIRNAEHLSVWDCARQILEVANAARDGSASKDQLTGSTITITSLGPLGGIVTTPVINHPEVAILGTNKIQMKPVWDVAQFIPRKIMNLSSSFDHRIIDGWECAVFIQRIKALLESPAEIFIQE